MQKIIASRRKFKSRLDAKQDVWRAVPALLGNGSGVVEIPNQPGYVYIRLGDDDLGQAFNNRCPLTDNLAVYVGYDPVVDPDRRIFQVLSVRMADYAGGGSTPAPNLPAHHTTHEFGGGDDVYVDWRRLMGLRVGRPVLLTVTVDQGIIFRAGVWLPVASQITAPLTVPGLSTQAYYALIALDSAGVVTVAYGPPVAIATLTIANCPVPAVGEIPLAAVRLYGGQTVINDTPSAPDIVDLRFPTYAATGLSGVGIANQVTYWSGTNTLAGDTRFRFDPATGFVGIGTIPPAPLYLLHVRAADGISDNSYVAYISNEEATVNRNNGLWINAGSSASDYNIRCASVAGATLWSVTGAGLMTINNVLDWAGGNVIYVPLTGDIQAYINAAVAGDTLILASGEYVITSTITVNKQLNIVGQGNAGFYTVPYAAAHGTVISSVTGAITGFHITASNVRVAHLSINLTGAASTGIDTANNLTGIVLTNIDVIVTCTGQAQGFMIWGSNAVLRNLSFYITSTNASCSGLYVFNTNATTQDAIVDCFTVTGITKGTAGDNWSYICENNNDANTITLNMSNSVCRALAGTALDVAVGAISATTNNAIVNCYMCTLDGQDYDAYQQGDGGDNQLNLGGSVLVNNLVFGTVTYRTAMAAGLGVFGSTVTLNGLTASTVVYSNASKAITSLANAAGVLTNNGAGALSWTGSGPGVIGAGTAQYQVITTGANPYPAAWSDFYIRGTTGGTTWLDVANTKTLKLTAADSYLITFGQSGPVVTGTQTDIKAITRWNATHIIEDSHVIDNATGAISLQGGGAACSLTFSNHAYSFTGGGTLALGASILSVTGGINPSTINGSFVGNVSGSGTIATGGFTLTVPATGTAVLGIGTASYIPRWSDANTLGNSTLRDNATTASIGVAPVANQLLTIKTATTTNTALVLQTSDDNITKNLQEYKGSGGTIVARMTPAGEGYFNSDSIKIGSYLGIAGYSHILAADHLVISAGGVGSKWIYFSAALAVDMTGCTYEYPATNLVWSGVAIWTVKAHGMTALANPGKATVFSGYDGTGGFDVVRYYQNQGTIGFLGSIAMNGKVTHTLVDATAGVLNIVALDSAGDGANNSGGSITMAGKSSTTAAQDMAKIAWLWNDATHATRKADLVLSAFDTAEREFLRGRGSGAAAMLSLYGGTPVVRGAALTAQLTTLTHTAPGTPDYAVQDFVDVALGAGWAFKDHDEANSVLAVIANLQVRVAELEARLGSATGINAFA